MNFATTASIAAATWRGAIIENRHMAHIAVTDSTGRLLRKFGDPGRITLVRSAAKPAQALAIIESGALEHFGFDEMELALMCASHSSEERHIALARRMLAKARAVEDDLRCGGHPALSEAVQRAWIRADFRPTPICSNCSGKHVGMLAAAQAMGSATADYHLPHHPVQTAVRHTVGEVCGLSADRVSWAVDGCNLPTPAFALDKLAFFYARLAAAADCEATGAPSFQHQPAMARVFNAMTRYPELVAGEGRFCSLLMTAFDGAIIAKVGADASYAVGVRASDQTANLGAQGALGIAVKVEDGNTSILYAIVCEVLLQLGLGAPAQRACLQAFHSIRQHNTVGIQTGSTILDFALSSEAG